MSGHPALRQAIELRLKAPAGEGSNFLPSPTDSITLYKTHSLRWLAQIVCQIIRKVRWDNEFKCEGVASLAQFSEVVNQLEALDPVSCAVRSSAVPLACVSCTSTTSPLRLSVRT